MPFARHHDVGKLGVFYTDGTNTDIFTVGLLLGEDPFNTVSMQAYADVLAGFVRAIMPSSITLTQWRSFDTNLNEALTAPLGPPVEGTHGTDSGFPAFKSLTTCITGATQAPTATNRVQQTRVFFQVKNTIVLTPGEKGFSKFVDSAYKDLVDHLNTNANYWGDAQGRKTLAREFVTVQLNSFLQHQRGS